MAVSPFTFYRGAANVMAADLGSAPHSGLNVQLCGDAHLANFGGFASAERSLVFDVNDFDETLAGPFEWDVKRLVASFDVAGRDRGLDKPARAALVASTTKAYRDAMRSFAAMSNLDLWYTQLDADQIEARWGAEAGTKALKNLQRTVAKAESKDRLKALAKLTREVDGELQFISDPPLIVPVEEIFSDCRRAASPNGHPRGASRVPPHAVGRSAPTPRELPVRAPRAEGGGVGSVGMRSWVALLVGRDNTDPLFLQVKEAEASVLEPFLKKSTYSNHGQRVVEGQRLMQATSDIFLGWQRVDGVDGRTHDYYMRQLWDWKASANIETMTPELLSFYGQICGWTLARAHAKSGDRIAIGEYLGTSESFDRAMAEFAHSMPTRTSSTMRRSRRPSPTER